MQQKDSSTQIIIIVIIWHHVCAICHIILFKISERFSRKNVGCYDNDEMKRSSKDKNLSLILLPKFVRQDVEWKCAASRVYFRLIWQNDCVCIIWIPRWWTILNEIVIRFQLCASHLSIFFSSTCSQDHPRNSEQWRQIRHVPLEICDLIFLGCFNCCGCEAIEAGMTEIDAWF